MRMTRWKLGGLTSGVAVFAGLTLGGISGIGEPEVERRAAAAAAVTALMAILWLTESLPIYATACLPLVLFPVVRPFQGGSVANLREAALPYVHPYIFLFMGGMGIAAAMQQWNLHRRIALGIMRRIGTGPRRLLLGVLLATACISLWISNTATATMMVPIALSVIREIERQSGGKRLPEFGAALMLAVAWGANVGGIGTKIGTAPNAQFAGFMERQGLQISFLRFSAVGLGFVVLFLPMAFALLWRVGRRDAPASGAGAEALREECARLGPVRRGEGVVLSTFAAAAVLWIFGQPLAEGLRTLSGLHRLTVAHVEGSVAMAAALLLMMLRVGGRQVLGLSSLRLVPWPTLLLLGGGFSMAEAIQGSGLSDWMAERMLVLRDVPPLIQVVAATVATVALSAVASNTATIAVMLNVLRGAVPAGQMTTVLFAATIASSCDFALPAGTPPNAIVFGSGYLTVPKMARSGAVLDLAAAVIAALWCSAVVPALVG